MGEQSGTEGAERARRTAGAGRGPRRAEDAGRPPGRAEETGETPGRADTGETPERAEETGETPERADTGETPERAEETRETPERADTGETPERADTGETPERADTGETPGRAEGVRERAVTRLGDPRALRAYAHPVRMALVGLLRTEGPLTATRAAELLGESSGTCSFHLRQLAKYGLVEEAGGGTGREKPWRATTTSTGWDAVTDTPEMAAATGLLQAVMAERYLEQLTRWLETSPDEPQEWQRAAMLGDRILYVTPAELEELGRQVSALLDEYVERLIRPELRPADARQVTWLDIAFPNDFRTGRR